MRKAFVNKLCELAQADERVIFLTADMGYYIFDDYRQRFPARFINVGIAEAALVDVAAGLAMEGMRPICYSIASFMTGRAWEQIKCANAMNLPILFVGVGGGYNYRKGGPTHHAAEDLGLMSLLPGMTVTAPGCPDEVSQLLPQLMALPGASYLRLGGYGEPDYEGCESAVVGSLRLLSRGHYGAAVAIVATGTMGETACMAGEALKAHGQHPYIFQMHTLSPIDIIGLDKLLRFKQVLVVEEHIPRGGLWATLAAWRAEQEQGPRLLRLGSANLLVKEAYQPVTSDDIVRHVMELAL